MKAKLPTVIIELTIVAAFLMLAAGLAHRGSSHHRDQGDEAPAQTVSFQAP